MRVLLSILLILLLLPTWSATPRLSLLDTDSGFGATPVPLDAAHPERTRVGALVFERGYRLSGEDPAFGGFSSLFVDRDRFLLLSDGGNFVRFRLGANGRLSDRSVAELPGGPFRGWDKTDRDSESLSYDAVSHRFWVGFENFNEIWRYSGGKNSQGQWHAERHSAPPAMRDWPANLGAEAMVRLRSGKFVVIAEDDPWPGERGRAAVLFAGDPTERPRRGFRFSYLAPSGYSPSDMAELPDRRLIILNRKFSVGTWFTTIVTIVDARQIRPGARVVGRVIARFDGSLTRDNYEGIAVVTEPDGVKLWIISDNNQSALEQTLLMKFRLDEATAPRR